MSTFEAHFIDPAILRPGYKITLQLDALNFLYIVGAKRREMGRQFGASVVVNYHGQVDLAEAIDAAVDRVDIAIKEWRDVTQPVDNGPHDLVWHSECLTQALTADDLDGMKRWLRRAIAVRREWVTSELPF